MTKLATWTSRIALAALVGAAATLPRQTTGAPPPPAPAQGGARAQADVAADAEAGIAMADRLVENAFAIMRSTPFAPPMWRQALALYRGATRLNPDEPRFWRLRIEAEMATGNAAGAVEALTAYRKLIPDDQWAQAQLIELYVARLEGADAKVSYLTNLLGRESVPADVRAHAAMLAARLLLERSNADALAMADRALQLNPLNPQALRMRYDLSGASAPPVQRLASILALLRGSPSQPLAMEEVGRILCSAGMNEQALDWFSRAMDAQRRTGAADPQQFHESQIGFASQLYMAGRAREAAPMVSAMLQADNDDTDAWFLRLMLEGGGADAAAKASLLQSAEQAFTNRWNAIAKSAADAPAATQPGRAESADNPADLASVVRRIRAAGNPALTQAASMAATDLAWFELYFNEQPASAQRWIDVLKAMLAANPSTIGRLSGWHELLEKKTDEARKTLTPLADRDPLAALGVIRLAGPRKENDPASAEADKLAARIQAQYRTGLGGALVWSALKDRNVPAAIPNELSAGVKAEITRFPRNWLDIVRDAKQFYALRIEPIRVAAPFHDPMYARISLQNTSDFELTIGDEGALRRDLWLDADILGPQRQVFQGVVFERMAGPMRLKPGQAVTQVVRVDQGALSDFLSANPNQTLQFEATVFTNPMLSTQGTAPGPAGRLASTVRRMARIGFNVSSEPARKKVLEEVGTGLPETRFRYLDMMATYVAALRAQQPPQPEAQPIIEDFARKIANMRDGAANTQVWAAFLNARLAPGDQHAQLVQQMAQSPAWESRLLALLAGDTLPFAQRKEIATQLADRDPDQVVKLFAEATLDLLNHPTTGPATQPATAPANMPGGGK